MQEPKRAHSAQRRQTEVLETAMTCTPWILHTQISAHLFAKGMRPICTALARAQVA